MFAIRFVFVVLIIISYGIIRLAQNQNVSLIEHSIYTNNNMYSNQTKSYRNLEERNTKRSPRNERLWIDAMHLPMSNDYDADGCSPVYPRNSPISGRT